MYRTAVVADAPASLQPAKDRSNIGLRSVGRLSKLSASIGESNLAYLDLVAPVKTCMAKLSQGRQLASATQGPLRLGDSAAVCYSPLAIMKEQRHRLPPLFQKNEVLFGHDGAPGLIAFEIDGDDAVKVFSRDGGALRSET